MTQVAQSVRSIEEADRRFAECTMAGLSAAQLLYRAAVEHLFQALAAPALASPEEARVVKLEIEMHLAQAEAVSFIMNGGFLKA